MINHEKHFAVALPLNLVCLSDERPLLGVELFVFGLRLRNCDIVVGSLLRRHGFYFNLLLNNKIKS